MVGVAVGDAGTGVLVGVLLWAGVGEAVWVGVALGTGVCVLVGGTGV